MSNIFKQDVDFIKKVAKEALGLDLLDMDAMDIWESYSEDLCAGWLTVDNREHVIEVLKMYVPLLLKQFNSLKKAEGKTITKVTKNDVGIISIEFVDGTIITFN